MTNIKECENCHVLNYEIGFILEPATGGLGYCDYYTNQENTSKCDGRRLYILKQQLLASKQENEDLKGALKCSTKKFEDLQNLDYSQLIFSERQILQGNLGILRSITNENKKMREALEQYTERYGIKGCERMECKSDCGLYHTEQCEYYRNACQALSQKEER